jgi:hypothetical protein
MYVDPQIQLIYSSVPHSAYNNFSKIFAWAELLKMSLI